MTLYERFEKLSEVDPSPATRRDVLSKAAKASLGVALVLAGLSRVEKAGASPDPVVGCCFLAFNTQCPNCSGHGYDCGAGCDRWAWYCVDPQHRLWLCGECYAQGSCGPGCSCGKVMLSTSNEPNPRTLSIRGAKR
jgi:hypothetical protein